MQSYGNLPNWQIFHAAFSFFNKCSNLCMDMNGIEDIKNRDLMARRPLASLSGCVAFMGSLLG